MPAPSQEDIPTSLDLPAGFVWGTSSSSYQIEGAAQLDGRGPSIWDTFCRQPGRVMNGDTGDIACDHYHRYSDDITLMQDLGVKAYRFSLAWPRVLPTGKGRPNEPGLAFYDRLIDALLRADIEPWLCLYHWDLPQALQDQGGWANRDCASWFADYAALVGRRFGDRVKKLATFNEPSVCTIFGHLLGTNAPGKTSAPDYLRAIHHFNLAHGMGTQALRNTVNQALIGCVYTLQPVIPSTPNDQQAARDLDIHWNRAFAEPQLLGYYPDSLATLLGDCIMPDDLATICQPQDWLGINHYSPLYARKTDEHSLGFTLGDAPAGVEKTAIGWPVDPQAFTATLVETSKKYGLPLYVTENGYGGYDSPDGEGQVHDLERVHYLARYTHAMADAIKQGADVRGYFVWSLLDNFEWAFGYGNRFGIVHVDFATQQRTLKASAHWYRQLIEKNHG